jgi:S-adenosylmethionine/arginine decarboxylase-like enzyme
MRNWGYHLVLNASRCGALNIRCAKNIKGFSDSLVRRIDMVPFGSPSIVHFGTGDKAGYTLVQLIETSNIMAHFSEEINAMFLDVFSCKEFNPRDVEEHVVEWFNPVHIESTFLKRGAYAKQEDIPKTNYVSRLPVEVLR